MEEIVGPYQCPSYKCQMVARKFERVPIAFIEEKKIGGRIVRRVLRMPSPNARCTHCNTLIFVGPTFEKLEADLARMQRKEQREAHKDPAKKEALGQISLAKARR